MLFFVRKITVILLGLSIFSCTPRQETTLKVYRVGVDAEKNVERCQQSTAGGPMSPPFDCPK